MADKYNRYLASTPGVFRPFDGTDVTAANWLANVPNPIINALLFGLATGDQEVTQAIEETKASLFVQTAENQFLDVLASSFGVARPAALGLPDRAFRDLIPPLSLQAKQVRTSFYNAMDAFWGPEFSRANIGTDQVNQFDTFDIRTNDRLSFQVDTRTLQTVVVRATDLQFQGAMTVNEFSVLLTNNLTGVSNEIIRDPINDRQFIRLLTSTPGLRGSLQFTISRTGAVTQPIIFPTTKSELISQAQRTVIYEIRPNELVIEIPAFIPSLARGLRGSEHLHNGPLLARILGRGETLSYRLPTDAVNQEVTLTGATVTNDLNIIDSTVLPFLSITKSSNNTVFDLVGTVPSSQAVDVYRPTIRYTKTQTSIFTPVTATALVEANRQIIFSAASLPPAIYQSGDILVITDSTSTVRNFTIVSFTTDVSNNITFTVAEAINDLTGNTPVTLGSILRVENTIFPIFIRIVADILNVTDPDIWVGSFLYDPNGLQSSFTITGQSARIVGDTTSGSSGLTAGEVHPRITVESGSNTLPTTSGLAVVGFGSGSQEPALVLYRGRANQSVIEIDPSFVFTNTHPEGTFINIVSAASPFVPDRQGNAYPVYLTSSTNAREIILGILRTLAAAGVFINFVILAPEYKYLVDNPYLTTDDRPTS